MHDKSSRSITLMCGNKEVLEFNFSNGTFNLFNKELLPYRLRNLDNEDVSLYLSNDVMVTKFNNAFVDWCASRVLLLSRKNAKKLYQAFRLNQSQDPISRAKLAIACRALSVLDNYWLKLSGDSDDWNSINLHHNKLNETLAQVALKGTSLTLQGSLVSPEFTTNGAYAKAWRRIDNKLYLHKCSDTSFETKIEECVSNILDCCNVAHCKYTTTTDDGLVVSSCEAMTTDYISILDGSNFCSYCNRSELSADREIVKLDPDGYYRMFIVDYLIANPDRHSQNWGLFYKSSDCELIGLHPLFDHNNAFDKEVMYNEDYDSHFLNKTLKENALYAMKKTDFHFVKPITPDLFLTDRQYEVFMKRANQLGIQVREKTIDDAIVMGWGYLRDKEKILKAIPEAVLNSNDLDLIQDAVYGIVRNGYNV